MVPLKPRACGGSEEIQNEVFCDSDWGGCEKTRKSTSGGYVTVQGAVVSAWSKTQGPVALSSAEAEFMALVKGATEGLSVKNFLEETGFATSQLVLWTGSSAALDMTVMRASKVKHMSLKFFFLKDKVDSVEVVVQKVAGKENPADLLTKGVSREVLHYLRHTFAC